MRRQINIRLIIVILAPVFLLGSCFTEIDTEKMDPLETITAANNIYTSQTFYKIEENQIRQISWNSRQDWDLGFETGVNGWHVIINYSTAARIVCTGITDYEAVDVNTVIGLFPVGDSLNWKFSHPNGDLDSTAVGNWIDSASVYILYRGAMYTDPPEAYFKIKFESVNANEYLITYNDVNTDVDHSVSISKDGSYNYVYYSFTDNDVVEIEPPRDNWDLLFTPFMGYYYINTGEGLPYFLNGVYSNYLNGVEVIEIDDANVEYDSIDASYINQYEFLTTQDVLGYDWKDIPQPPDYVYYIDENKKYIIHAVDGSYYKFRFISYYNEMGDKGFPIFQYKQIL